MATSIIPGTGIIVSVEYAPDGLAWARLYDNRVVGWYVDTEIPPPGDSLRGGELVADAGPRCRRARPAASSGRPLPTFPASRPSPPLLEGSQPLAQPPLAPGVPPVPVILGHLAAAAVPTAPILSPQWGEYVEPNVFIADIWRSTVSEFFTWLATNNGAHRPLGSRLLVDASLQRAFSQWAADNPELAFAGDPPI